MLSLNDLIKGTKKLAGVPDYTPVRIKSFKRAVNLKKGTLTIVTKIKGASKETYRTIFKFLDLDIDTAKKREKCVEGDFKFKSDGTKKNYCITKISLNKTPVQCRCSCPRFRFAFSFYINKLKGLYGGPIKKYKRKTKTRPPVNPFRTPGMCKHLWRLLKTIQDKNMLKTKKTLP